MRRTPKAIALLVVASALLPGQRVSFRRVTSREFTGSDIRGGALALGDPRHPPRLISWGDGLRISGLPKARTQEFRNEGKFGAGGCLVDVDQDGVPDLVLNLRPQDGEKLGKMVWLQAPDWQLRTIDKNADFDDCMATTLFGKRGVLLIHRRMQVRFYEIPAKPDDRWPYREIYSIYTPSAQGGLLRADVDGDGKADIICGNYWIKLPDSAGLPWQLFAINNWWEKPRSAMLRLAMGKPLDTPFPILVAAEAEASPARLAWFERPADPRKMWLESKLDAIPPIRKPQALAVADLNGDLHPDIIVGENAGEGSRLLIYWALGGGRYQGTSIDVTSGLIGVWAVDFDGDGDLDLVGLGPKGVTVWLNQRLK